MRKYTFPSLFFVLMSVSGCGRLAAPVERFYCRYVLREPIVAYIDGLPVTETRLKEFYARKTPSMGPALAADMASEAGRGRLLSWYLDEAATERVAVGLGLDKTDLYKSQMTEARHRTLKKLLKDQFQKTHPISDKELQDYYAAHQKEYEAHTTVRFRTIETGTLKEMKTIMASLAGGVAFETLTNKEAGVDTDPEGDSLVIFPAHPPTSPVDVALWRLKKDAVSRPIKIKTGYCLLKKYAETIEDARPLETVRAEIRDQLTLQKYREWLDQKKAATHLETVTPPSKGRP
jgi:hypothetical protein